MNDTPRTNHIIDQIKGFRTSSAIYSLEQFSRELETELTAVTEQRDKLAEALRKAISWGDSASHHILHRQNINWTYLDEAREALQSLNQPTEP